MGAEHTQPSGQDPTAGPGQDPTTQAPPQAGGTTMTLEAAQEALAAARREAAANRTELAALKKAQADAENATLTEHQKTARERDTLKAELEAARIEARDRVNRYEVQLAASRLGIVDPDAAVRLLDWDSLEYATDGSPKGVDAALRKLLAAKPYLASPAGPATSTANPATRASVPGARTYTRSELQDYDFYSKNRDDIVKAMREGRVTD